MNHSRRLREKIELIAPTMHRAIDAFWTHPRMQEIFPGVLVHNLLRRPVDGSAA